MPTVSYKGLIAEVRDQDLQQGIAILSQESRAGRRKILAGVKRVLDKAARMTPGQHQALPPKQLQDIADDIGLWFAGEVLAGRPEQYKVAVQ